MKKTNEQYLQSITRIFKQYKSLAEKAIEQIDAKQLFIQPNENSNSVAVIVKHMAGNMISRWTDFFTTDGEKPDRNRDGEFENDITDKEILLKRWEEGWKVFLDTLASIKPEDLQRTIYIRGEAHTAIEAINRQLAHYPYHVGQIVYAAKLLKDTEWSTLSIAKNRSAEFNKEKFSGKN
ncbi:MAG TPA: DinB family protein [Bacteroidia bacterium]|nr:DinB family protein [Bacteroidia bacterium]